jgi:hypothetical protein
MVEWAIVARNSWAQLRQGGKAIGRLRSDLRLLRLDKALRPFKRNSLAARSADCRKWLGGILVFQWALR